MAASSLTEALQELGRQWAARGHPAPRFAFAASAALARQVEQGAPADIVAFADPHWTDYLETRGLLTPGTRIDVLGNALVVVAPAEPPPAPLALAELPARLGPGRLAIGDPASVPAGHYAQAALRTLGLWDGFAPRLARAANVRAALLLVERGEAPLGIVYATDAAAAPAVHVVAIFPAAMHPPIRYPFALTGRGDTPETRALFAFLTGPEAATTYRRLGFRTP